MGKPNRTVIALDHLCSNGAVEGFGRNACSFEQRRRGRAERRGKRKCATGVDGEPADPCPNELLERFRDRQRLERADVLIEEARDLQRVKRVSRSPFVYTYQRLAGVRTSRPISQQSVQ